MMINRPFGRYQRVSNLGFIDMLISGLLGLGKPSTQACPAPPPPPWYGTPSGAVAVAAGGAVVGGLLVTVFGGRK